MSREENSEFLGAIQHEGRDFTTWESVERRRADREFIEGGVRERESPGLQWGASTGCGSRRGSSNFRKLVASSDFVLHACHRSFQAVNWEGLIPYRAKLPSCNARSSFSASSLNR